MAGFAVLVCVVAAGAFGHSSLEAYVRENVFISVNASNIDIRIQFSFPADLSLVERKRMDRDGTGAISAEERIAYLKEIEDGAEKMMRITVNGQDAALIPLEDPVLDLQDAPGVEAHPHELRLAYFARLPKDFGVGSAVALDSGLWADTPLLVSVSMEGAKGIRFQRVDLQGLRQASEDGMLFRITEARCVLWEPDDTSGRK